MTLLIVLYCQLVFHHVWNPKEPIPKMAATLMASPLFPRNVAGHLITWDFTCPDTFAPCHLPHSSVEPGAVAADAKNSKALKYLLLSNTSHFIPVAVETTGAFVPSALAFLHEIGRRIKIQTGDQSSHYYLLQHISIAIQRGNAESVLGTMSHSSADSPLFF